MAVRPIRLLGDPILRCQCDAVAAARSPAARVVADDLQDTLRDLKSRHGMGRGLAAPQIGAPMRLVYIEIDEPWLLVNPEITDVGSQDFLVWDDCFSVPNLLVRVQRAHQVRVTYHDLAGKAHHVDVEGAVAELLQHELDHLDGVLLVDHPAGLDPFCLREEWNRHYASGGRYGSPFDRGIGQGDGLR